MPLQTAVVPATPLVSSIIDPREDYRKRIAEVDSLSAGFEVNDQRAIENFLTHKGPQDSEQLGHVLKNELFNKLCSMSPPPSWLADALIQICNDHGQNVVVRDYAVQHMVELYRSLPDDQSKEALQSAIWRALAETEDSIGGTALLGLERLSQDYNEFDHNKIAEAANWMAKQESVSELARITAFQVCGEMGVTDALPVILRAAQTSSSVPLRISAVGAVGLLGGADQIPFLNGLINGDEDRLKPAARHAVDQITIRQNRLASH
jgi:hypothetical protein